MLIFLLVDSIVPALLGAPQGALHVCGICGDTCIGWQEAGRPSYTLSSLLVP